MFAGQAFLYKSIPGLIYQFKTLCIGRKWNARPANNNSEPINSA
jgi:hypothetical protein